jgi:hypothetical protein
MFTTIDEVIEEFFKDWKKLPLEELNKNIRRLWTLIGEYDAFYINTTEKWNEVYQKYINNTRISIPIYRYAYVNNEVVLISPTGNTKILSEDEKNVFDEETDYIVKYGTEEKNAATAISDYISKKYSF